ncbi:hypothetical protein GS504_01540 [Rhodococcus hoagii]|nr:hypothetical protein [Prescottella equi]NKS71644.1 hypothetical protein [Prescottella equi]
MSTNDRVETGGTEGMSMAGSGTSSLTLILRIAGIALVVLAAAALLGGADWLPQLSAPIGGW